MTQNCRPAVLYMSIGQGHHLQHRLPRYM